MELTHKTSLANVPLQIMLFSNSCLSILYAVVIGAVAVEKSIGYSHDVPIVALFLWVVIEPIRLSLGFSGNLTEKVPNLATYLLMTVFPQLPLVVYLGYLQGVTFPIDNILGSFMLICLVSLFVYFFLCSDRLYLYTCKYYF
jgi:hypothetical protein